MEHLCKQSASGRSITNVKLALKFLDGSKLNSSSTKVTDFCIWTFIQLFTLSCIKLNYFYCLCEDSQRKKKIKSVIVQELFTQEKINIWLKKFYSLKVIVWKIKSILDFCDDSTESTEIFAKLHVCVIVKVRAVWQRAGNLVFYRAHHLQHLLCSLCNHKHFMYSSAHAFSIQLWSTPGTQCDNVPPSTVPLPPLLPVPWFPFPQSPAPGCPPSLGWGEHIWCADLPSLEEIMLQELQEKKYLRSLELKQDAAWTGSSSQRAEFGP